MCAYNFTVLGSSCIAFNIALFSSPPHPPLPYSYYYLSSSTGHRVQCDGCLGGGQIWQMALVAVLWVWQVLGCSTYLGLG